MENALKYFRRRCKDLKVCLDTSPVKEELKKVIAHNEKAVESLEKQIPQKIIFNSEDDREYEDYICPNCKDILQQRRKSATAITIYKFKYCHNCGQALDWGENPKD